MSTSPRMVFKVVHSVTLALLLNTMLLTGTNFSPVLAKDGAGWNTAHATFYGGDDASGTMGGACGYGNMYARGYGVRTTALSQNLFNGGLACGSCYQVKCIVSQSRWCYARGGTVTVTATNLCPPNYARRTDGWCNPPRIHFDLSYPMFAMLAKKVGGIIPIQYRRVSCLKKGGIRFSMHGNPWFILLLVYNVGGAGNVVYVEMKGSRTGWYRMTHNWGQNWELKQMLVGQALSIKVTLGNGQQIVSGNVAAANWRFGQNFESRRNF